MMMDELKDTGSTATPIETATCTAAEHTAVNSSTDDGSPSGHEASTDTSGTKQLPSLSNDQDDAGSSTLTESRSSSSLSSSSMESAENSYTSFEPLVDESGAKENIRFYDSDSDSEDTGDEKYRKKVDKGKGKEIAPRVPDHGSVPPAAEGQQVQPLNNVPWVQDPERPPQKLPIRFTDCLGRNFVWPWKKVKTWEGAKSLIESAFLHVDVLGPHVFASRYELTIQGMWSDSKTAAINPALTSYPPATNQSSNSAPFNNSIGGFGTAGLDSSSSFQPGSPPSTDVLSHLLAKMPGRGAIILPELWEDVVEPGMLILMRMWPIVSSQSTLSHTHPMYIVPMPPPSHIHVVPIVPVGRGRGRGASSAAGRGLTQQPPPQQQQHWHHQPPRMRSPPRVVIPSPPKGKTRKRQDGL